MKFVMNKIIEVKFLILIAVSIIIASCKTTYPTMGFVQSVEVRDSAIDYSKLHHWAAHPDKIDEADKIPNNQSLADQSHLKADVFFIHPTTYTGKKGEDQWNGSIDDESLNKRTDESTIRSQASIFNAAGRVYAPRYRQAHIAAYFTKDKSSAKQAFELAYQDVKSAFKYYLDNEALQRPFIIASHSQGTTHAKRLIKELIDGHALQKKMIAAYLVGMPIAKKEFTNIEACQSEDQTHCFVSWRTYKKGHLPGDLIGDHILVTNPLSWNLDKTYQPKSLNQGAILRNFNKVLKGRVDAQIENGVLWASKPKFPWSFLFTTDNYHIADLNFYYFNVKNNAINRVENYLNK